eukprot:3973374-Ditylum_brightwellii.AAC.1
MSYSVETPKRGWELKPERTWDGMDKTFKFRVKGKSDSGYAKCHQLLSRVLCKRLLLYLLLKLRWCQ